jgi:hypothetical protein
MHSTRQQLGDILHYSRRSSSNTSFAAACCPIVLHAKAKGGNEEVTWH